jgi:hypothetical protein
MSEICCLDKIVSIEGVRDTMFTIIISMSCYLHFVSYTLTLASLGLVNLYWRRLSSCILSWVCDDVSLNVGSIGCVVGDIACGIDRDVCRGVDCRVSWSISCSIISGIDRLHYFIFTSSLFSYWLKGTLAATSLAGTFRYTPGVGTCYESAISRTYFFNLGGGDMNIGLETSDRWRIFKVIWSGKSGSQVGL